MCAMTMVSCRFSNVSGHIITIQEVTSGIIMGCHTLQESQRITYAIRSRSRQLGRVE